jgi:hypothetical protein
LPLHKLRHWLVIKQILRAAGEVIQFDVFRVDAEVAVQRCENLTKVHWAFDGFAAKSIGRSNHLPGIHAATGEQSAANSRPVVATSVFVDSGCSAELTPRDH